MKNNIRKLINFNPKLPANKLSYVLFISDDIEDPHKIAPMGLFNLLLSIIKDHRTEIKIFPADQIRKIEQLADTLDREKKFNYIVCKVQTPNWFPKLIEEKKAEDPEAGIINPICFSISLEDIYAVCFSNSPEFNFYNVDDHPYAIQGEKETAGVNSYDCDKIDTDNFWLMEAIALAKARMHRYE